MIDHFGINVRDLERSATSTTRCSASSGIGGSSTTASRSGTAPRCRPSGSAPCEGVGPNREVHVAFQAPDAAAVRAFVAAATELGAEVLHEPRLFPEYHETYYGGFVRDTEGDNVEAVCPPR